MIGPWDMSNFKIIRPPNIYEGYPLSNNSLAVAVLIVRALLMLSGARLSASTVPAKNKRIRHKGKFFSFFL